MVTAVEKIILTPAHQFGGNHKHPRTELFIACNKGLVISWKDANGTIHQEQMYNESEVSMWVVPSGIPHIIMNESDTDATLFEFADAKQHDVESVDLLLAAK